MGFFPSESRMWAVGLVAVLFWELKVLEKLQGQWIQRLSSSPVCQKVLGRGVDGHRQHLWVAWVGQQWVAWDTGGEADLQEHQEGGQGFSEAANPICCVILHFCVNFWVLSYWNASWVTGVPAGKHFCCSSPLTAVMGGGNWNVDVFWKY